MWDDNKVITALVGNCRALQNGSHILLSLHRHFAIPVSRRCLVASRPEWRQDNSEDSRMCDPFCKAQQFPTDAAISLSSIFQFLHFANTSPAFCSGGVKIPCLGSRKNWPILFHDVQSLLSGRLLGVVRPLEDNGRAMGEDNKPSHVGKSIQQLFPHVDVALSLVLLRLLHVSVAEMPQGVVLVVTICGDVSYSAFVVVTHCRESSLALLVVTICRVKSVALLVLTICPVDSRALLVFTICLGESMSFTCLSLFGGIKYGTAVVTISELQRLTQV